MATLYELLEVQPDVSPDELKRAHRRLVRRWHPDSNPNDPNAAERFREVQGAYDVLGDPVKRRDYDRSLEEVRVTDTEALTELLNRLGGARLARRDERERSGPVDVHVPVVVTLADAFHGRSVDVEFDAPTPCRACRATGALDGTAIASCGECSGTGVIDAGSSWLGIAHACARCAGSGELVTAPCPECGGSGACSRPRRERFTVPLGAQSGDVVRLADRGARRLEANKPGDLYLRLRVLDQAPYRRVGANLHLDVAVSYAEAVLGASVEIPTLDGVVALRVPAGCFDGKLLRLRELGMPRGHRGERGNLIARIRIDVPKETTPQQREALEALARVFDHDPRGELRAVAKKTGRKRKNR